MARDRMTITEHLEEVRRRLIWCALALVVTVGISFAYSQQLFSVLLAPVTGPIREAGGNIAFLGVAEGFLIQFRLAVYVGLVLASPVIGYHILAFILPGLTPRERRYIWTYLPTAVLLFIAGTAMAYLLFLPAAVGFLVGFNRGQAETLVSATNLVGFVTGFIMPFGFVFELPLVVALLTRLGLITPRALGRMRKFAVLLAFVVAAVITPSPDIITQSLVALPLYALFESSIVVSRVVRRGMDRRAAEEAAESDASDKGS